MFTGNNTGRTTTVPPSKLQTHGREDCGAGQERVKRFRATVRRAAWRWPLARWTRWSRSHPLSMRGHVFMHLSLAFAATKGCRCPSSSSRAPRDRARLAPHPPRSRRPAPLPPSRPALGPRDTGPAPLANPAPRHAHSSGPTCRAAPPAPAAASGRMRAGPEARHVAGTGGGARQRRAGGRGEWGALPGRARDFGKAPERVPRPGPGRQPQLAGERGARSRSPVQSRSGSQRGRAPPCPTGPVRPGSSAGRGRVAGPPSVDSAGPGRGAGGSLPAGGVCLLPCGRGKGALFAAVFPPVVRERRGNPSARGGSACCGGGSPGLWGGWRGCPLRSREYPAGGKGGTLCVSGRESRVCRASGGCKVAGEEEVSGSRYRGLVGRESWVGTKRLGVTDGGSLRERAGVLCASQKNCLQFPFSRHCLAVFVIVFFLPPTLSAHQCLFFPGL